MEIDIIQELTGRYMRVTLEEKTGIFGTEMLKYNDVEGVIGAQIHNVDSGQYFLYPLENMVSVSELFEKNIFTMQNLVDLLEQLLGILNRCRDYFLEEKNLVLLCDYMFYHEKSGQLKVAYLDGFDADVGDGISKLLETFMDRMNHRDKELVFFVYGLHRISRDSHFNLKEFSDFIVESAHTENQHMRQGYKDGKKLDDVPRYESGRNAAERTRTDSALSVSEEETQGERNNIGKNALFLAVGLAVFVIVVKSGLLSKPVSGELDIMKTVIFGLVLLAVEGYLLGIGKEKLRHGGEEKARKGEEDEDCDQTIALARPYSDETVALEQMEPEKWYVNLIPNDWQREEIKVRKSPFFVGKDAIKSDGIIGDGEVSRVHAKIVMEEDRVFIIDQESTNGTFINGKQIIPWERCPVENGDTIGISSIYYKAEVYQ